MMLKIHRLYHFFSVINIDVTKTTNLRENLDMQQAIASSAPKPGTENAVLIEEAEQKQHALSVRWSDGNITSYHYLWLRDNCASGFHPDTQERCFDQLSVSADIHPIRIEFDTECLSVDWSEGDHSSRYPLSWLREFAYSEELRRQQTSSYESWASDFVERIPAAEQPEVMSSDEVLYHWMSDLDKHGLAIIRKMPATDEAVVDTAQRIDYLRRTNFGVTFNVISVPKPINLAYTSIALPLHTDLANQEVPPGYQFLHCLANESEGGASTFVDGLRVLEDLREEAPEHFRLLAEHPIPFRFHDEDHDIRQHHPVINLDCFGNIVEIKYNAHLADIFDLPEVFMHEYYLAYRNLMGRLKDPRYMIRLKLKGGEMVVFDNRRVLHGRDAFDPTTGLRHLRGCYVDRSEFKSRLRVLAKQFA